MNMGYPYQKLGCTKTDADRLAEYQAARAKILERIDQLCANLRAERAERKKARSRVVPIRDDGRNPCAFCSHDGADHGSTLSTACYEESCDCVRFVGMPRGAASLF